MNTIRRFILASLCSALAGFAAAAEVAKDDTTIVLGERVGPIKLGMTLAQVKELLGAKNVVATDVPAAEGETTPGAEVFKGTDRELVITLDPEGQKDRIFDIRIVGKAWKFENGLKTGATIPEVEKINGGAFHITGFEWDYGGYADFGKGKLAGKVMVRFDPGVKELDTALLGERKIPTTDKKMLAAKPKVAEITVVFRNPK